MRLGISGVLEIKRFFSALTYWADLQKTFQKTFLQMLQISGGFSASFLKIKKYKFSKFLLLPLSGITKVSEKNC